MRRDAAWERGSVEAFGGRGPAPPRSLLNNDPHEGKERFWPQRTQRSQRNGGKKGGNARRSVVSAPAQLFPSYVHSALWPLCPLWLPFSAFDRIVASQRFYASTLPPPPGRTHPMRIQTVDLSNSNWTPGHMKYLLTHRCILRKTPESKWE
jgi:hypothetical protein